MIRTTGQVAYQRLMLELKNNSPHCDVLSSTDISHYAALKARGALARYAPENAAGLAPAFDGLGEAGLYYPTTATLYVLTYNSQTVKPDEAPRSWTDLLDPRWKNQVATGHPAFSGYAGIWALAMRKLYGWDYFERLAKNQPRIGRSGLDPLTMLNAREVRGGLRAAVRRAAGRRQGQPARGPLSGGRRGAVHRSGRGLADAPHPNAARLFLEWLLSTEFARACVAVRGRSGAPRRRAHARRQEAVGGQAGAAHARGDRQGHPRDHRAVARYVRRLTRLNVRRPSAAHARPRRSRIGRISSAFDDGRLTTTRATPAVALARQAVGVVRHPEQGHGHRVPDRARASAASWRKRGRNSLTSA
ncbi:MAG: extracellular solute-binding protein [Pseudomonadota bacterium]